MDKGVSLEHTCSSVSLRKWESLMDGAVRANTAKIKQIFRKHRPECIDPIFYTGYCYNPYTHFRTDTHLIFVHSGIEHFFKIH